MKDEVYRVYIETVNFLGENQTYLDVESHDLARKINHEIGKSLLEFESYIEQIRLIEAENNRIGYNPELANDALKDDVSDINEKFEKFVTLIKTKERFKLATN